MPAEQEAFAAKVADAAAAKIIERALDPDFAEQWIDTYSASIQRAVGRAVIKTGLWILGAVLLWAGYKIGLFDTLLKGPRP